MRSAIHSETSPQRRWELPEVSAEVYSRSLRPGIGVRCCSLLDSLARIRKCLDDRHLGGDRFGVGNARWAGHRSIFGAPRDGRAHSRRH